MDSYNTATDSNFEQQSAHRRPRRARRPVASSTRSSTPEDNLDEIEVQQKKERKAVGWSVFDEDDPADLVKKRKKGFVSKLFGTNSAGDLRKTTAAAAEEDTIIPAMDESTKKDYEDDEADMILASIPTLQDHDKQGSTASLIDTPGFNSFKVQRLEELDGMLGRSAPQFLSQNEDGIDLSVLTSVMYNFEQIKDQDEPWTEQMFHDLLYSTHAK